MLTRLGQIVLIGTCVLCLAILAGCEKPQATAAKQPLRKLRVQLAWINDAEFIGYFVAKDKKWYEEEGLDVEFLPGGPDVIPEARLISGEKVDIALTTPDTTANLIVKDGYPLRIIGTQYQKSPLGMVSLKRSNIREPEDLYGKKLAVPPVNMISVEALFKLRGMDKSRVVIVPYQYDPTPLIQGSVDATIDFTTNVPYTIKQKGGDPSSFLLWDKGFTIYNDTLVVREDTLRSRRDDLIRFLRASRRGWSEALRDPSFYPKQFRDTWFKGNGRETQLEESYNTLQKPLIETDAGIFVMTKEGIDRNLEALRAINLLIDRSVFDNSLIEELDKK